MKKNISRYFLLSIVLISGSYMCAMNKDNINRTDKNGQTPLHKACLSNDFKKVKGLVEKQNANPDIANHFTGFRPIYLTNKREIVKYLTEECFADLNSKIKPTTKKIFRQIGSKLIKITPASALVFEVISNYSRWVRKNTPGDFKNINSILTLLIMNGARFRSYFLTKFGKKFVFDTPVHEIQAVCPDALPEDITVLKNIMLDYHFYKENLINKIKELKKLHNYDSQESQERLPELVREINQMLYIQNPDNSALIPAFLIYNILEEYVKITEAHPEIVDKEIIQALSKRVSCKNLEILKRESLMRYLLDHQDITDYENRSATFALNPKVICHLPEYLSATLENKSRLYTCTNRRKLLNKKLFGEVSGNDPQIVKDLAIIKNRIKEYYKNAKGKNTKEVFARGSRAIVNYILYLEANANQEFPVEIWSKIVSYLDIDSFSGKKNKKKLFIKRK